MTGYSFSQITIFSIVYLSYMSTYLLRMPFGVIKSDLLKIYDVSPKSVGYLDLAFLLPYAFVSLTAGSKVDTYGPHLTLSVSLFIAAASTFLLPYCDSYVAFLSLVFVGGASQALCWPASCSLISGAFRTSESSALGLFGSCCFVGGIVGKCLSVYTLATFSWAMVFFIPSIVVVFNSLFLLILSQNLRTSTPSNRKPDTLVLLSKHTLSPWQTFRLPAVRDISLTFFFIKSIRYIFMFWLPLYMHKALHYSPTDAGYASLSFDIGGIFGSCLIGYASKQLMSGRDMLVCLLSFVGFTAALLLFWLTSQSGWLVPFVLLLFAGSFNGGSDVLLVGSVAVSLSRRFEDVSSTSLVAFMNGIGSLGAMLEGPVVSYVSERFGWDSVPIVILLYSLVGMTLALKAHFIMKTQII